ncbi:MAG: DUF4013 domain-containing protein [Planctomycetaceae bacterium]|nr:DUF4013 domain-containing protein [Planctomycetaceae bacterium]
MSQGENPYSAPNNPPLPTYAAAQAPAMDYAGAYGFVFQSEAWVPNLFFTLLAALIPIIGQIIVMGYQFEIVEALIRDPRRVYPDFDWGKFTQYLTRGVWPFLISLIVGVVVAPVAWVLMIGMMLLLSLLGGAGNDAAALAGIVALVSTAVGVIMMMVLLQLVISAFQLRAGLAQDFAASFDFAWVRDYVARIWVELLLSGLFLVLTGWVLALGGLLLFCIGIYLAMAWIMLAQAHLHFQLYRLYLARGGREIPLKPLPPAMPAYPR